MPESILKSDTWRTSNMGEDRKEEFDRDEKLQETVKEETAGEKEEQKKEA